MATAKKTTKKKKEEPVVTPEEVVTTQEEIIETPAKPVTPDLPDYSNLSPFGRLMAGGGVD